MKTKTKIHYSWIIMTIMCLAQGAVVGIVSNCVGLFYIPVSKELGCNISDISFSSTLFTLGNFIAIVFFAKKMIFKIKVKYVFLIANILLLSRVILCFTSSIVWWWILCFLSGLGASVLMGFATNIILERWFAKKLPTALSTVGACSGMFGIVMSYAIGKMILSLGWRPALFISTILILLFNIPTFWVYLSPSEKGLSPYGMDAGSTNSEVEGKNPQNIKLKINKKMIFCIVLGIINATLTTFIAHIATFGESIDFALDSSILVTMFMIGNLGFKLLYGWAVEKLGLKIPSIATFVLIALGFGGILSGNTILAIIGALFLGSLALVFTTMVPLVQKSLYTSEEFPTISQITYIPYNLAHALFVFLYGYVFDITQSYLPVVFFILVAITIASIMILTLKNDKK